MQSKVFTVTMAVLMALTNFATLATPARADKIVFASTRTGLNQVYTMNPDGTGVTQLTTADVNEGVPCVSPDGTEIAWQKTLDVYYMNLDGSNQTRIAIGSGPAAPAFVPGTNLVGYSAPGTPAWDIYTIAKDGTGQKAVVSNPYASTWPRWSPDGTKIVFHSYLTSSSTPDIFVTNADGTGQVVLTTTHADSYPSWSPDGGQIAFQSTRDGGGSQIYIMNADGSHQTRITNDTANDSLAGFSPNGKQLVFCSDRDGTMEIYTMNVDGSSQTKITAAPPYNDCPTWATTIPANAPSASISDATGTASKTGSITATYTVSLSAVSTSAITVNYATYDGTAVAGTDYTAESGTLTFAAGVTSQSFSVPIAAAPLYAPTKNYTVRISAIGATIAKQVGAGTILNANPEPSLAIANVTQAEGTSGTSQFNFPVALSGASSLATTVNFATADGTALAGTDYVATSGTLTIPAGITSGTIAVPVYGSPILTNSKTFTVTLSGPVNATLSTAAATGTILDTSTTPGISVGNASASEGSPAVFTITLGHVAANAITASYATANGTATAGTNYVSTTGSVTIPAGQLIATVTVATLATTTPSAARTFTLNLTAAPGAVITGAQGVGTIANTDFPKIYTDNVSLLSGNTGTREMYFSLCLSDPAPFPVTFNYATSDGTAVAGKDYAAVAGTCTLPAGVASQPLGVPIFGTTTYGPNKTFTVTLSSPVNGTILTPTSTGTIISSAKLPAVYVNNLTEVQPVSGTASAPFHLTLTNPSSSAITLNYATVAGTAVAGTDFTSASGTVTFPAGAVSEPVTITILGHANPKNGATFTLSLSSPTGASTLVNGTTGPV